MKPVFSLAISAIVAASSFGIGAVPASAASVPFCNAAPYDIADRAHSITKELGDLGYSVARLETWNGCLRAFVVDENGHQHSEYFDPISLKPVL